MHLPTGASTSTGTVWGDPRAAPQQEGTLLARLKAIGGGIVVYHPYWY